MNESIKNRLVALMVESPLGQVIMRRGKPVAVAKPEGRAFAPGNRPLTPEEQAAKLKGQEERRGRRGHLDLAARRQGVTSLVKSAGRIILPYLKSGGTIKKGV